MGELRLSLLSSASLTPIQPPQSVETVYQQAENLYRQKAKKPIRSLLLESGKEMKIFCTNEVAVGIQT